MAGRENSKKKKKKDKEGSYAIPPNMMKLVTLVTLLVSDADVLFTFTSFYSYMTNTKPDPDNPGKTLPDPLNIMVIVVSLFTFVYVGGCIIAARESQLFVFRFREKVRLNEIAGLDVEEMDLFFSGKPVRCAEQRSLEQVEQAFQDKAHGRATPSTRAAKDGHITLSRSATGLGGGGLGQNRQAGKEKEEEEDGEGFTRLAPTPEEAVRKYNEDKERALYLLCQAKDITFAFFRERRSFARRVVKPSHSIPLIRLMVYGWQPTVSHTDFAGILNANALYSFTIGFPQLGCSIIYILNYKMDPILILSLVIGTISLVLSVMNMILDFPKQLFDIAQREGEAHVFALQAEEKSEFWTQKMDVEVQQQQEDMLKLSAQESVEQGGAPIEKPLSIIRKVMEIEADCMRARVDYVAHQMFMALHESEQRQAIRGGSLPNPYASKAADSNDEADEEMGRTRSRAMNDRAVPGNALLQDPSRSVGGLPLPPPREEVAVTRPVDADADGAVPGGGALGQQSHHEAQQSHRGQPSNRGQESNRPYDA